MKLNLGCGFRKLPGWLNVDVSPACDPDQAVDVEQVPWPWPDNSVTEVLMSHVLEHLGQTPASYLAIIQELWRVCAPDASVTILVPHPRHDSFLGDPTHVRPITAHGLMLFDRARNAEWIAKGAGNTPLGLMLGIDFSVESVKNHLDPRWRAQMASGKVTAKQIQALARSHANVIQEIHVQLRAIKPARDVSALTLPVMPDGVPTIRH